MKNTSRRTMALTATVAAAALVLAACGNGDGDGNGNGGDSAAGGEGGLLEQLQEAGSITVGFAGEEPYSYTEDGEATGASIALHREVVSQLGIDEVAGQEVEWGERV